MKLLEKRHKKKQASTLRCCPQKELQIVADRHIGRKKIAQIGGIAYPYSSPPPRNSWWGWGWGGGVVEG